MIKITTKSEKDTFKLGQKLARRLCGGEVLALIGELGSGKTVLIKGIAAGLGIKKHITSPTFVLMKVYPVRSSSKGSLNRESKGEAPLESSHNRSQLFASSEEETMATFQRGEAAFAALINFNPVRSRPAEGTATTALGRSASNGVKKKDIHKTSNGVYPINNQQSTIDNLVHIDAYRLNSGQDLVDIGLNDWLGRPDTVTVIEWADRVKDVLPKNKIVIKFKVDRENDERIINITNHTNSISNNTNHIRSD